jgi:hypothetical protein
MAISRSSIHPDRLDVSAGALVARSRITAWAFASPPFTSDTFWKSRGSTVTEVRLPATMTNTRFAVCRTGLAARPDSVNTPRTASRTTSIRSGGPAGVGDIPRISATLIRCAAANAPMRSSSAPLSTYDGVELLVEMIHLMACTGAYSCIPSAIQRAAVTGALGNPHTESPSEKYAKVPWFAGRYARYAGSRGAGRCAVLWLLVSALVRKTTPPLRKLAAHRGSACS